MNISSIIQDQKNFFNSQQTKDVSYRKKALLQLKKEIIKRENAIVTAIHNDFKKPEFESVLSETSIVLSELKRTLKNLNSWTKPTTVLPSLLNFPSWSKIHKEPYGTTLIIAPWNYPFQLVFVPLIGAIAAGNTAVVKPSELTPNTSKICKEIIDEVFEKEHVSIIEGGVEISQQLLNERWDYIFFTGSVHVGKIVAQSAAKYLTPVTLELGGKNPCIIDQTAIIKLATKRIVWGKHINGGQTCIAPDYILIHKDVKKEFVEQYKIEISKAYGEDPQLSEDFPRIVNEKNFLRLEKLMQNETILAGGKSDMKDLYISPTLIDEPELDSEIMQEEIFGPVLPVISYSDSSEIDTIISTFEKPLALYVFTKNKTFSKKIIKTHSFGGGAINDTTVHFANHHLPFGGVGYSGIGAYHGKGSFETFSHKKGITKRYNWLDVPIRYAPYSGKLKSLKFLMKWFG